MPGRLHASLTNEIFIPTEFGSAPSIAHQYSCGLNQMQQPLAIGNQSIFITELSWETISLPWNAIRTTLVYAVSDELVYFAYSKRNKQLLSRYKGSWIALVCSLISCWQMNFSTPTFQCLLQLLIRQCSK